MVQRVTSGMGMTGPTTLEETEHYKRVRYQNSKGTFFDFIDHVYGGQFALDGHCVPGGTDFKAMFGTTCSTPVEATAQMYWGMTVLDFFLEAEGR